MEHNGRIMATMGEGGWLCFDFCVGFLSFVFFGLTCFFKERDADGGGRGRRRST